MAATSVVGETHGTCRCCLDVGYHKDIPDAVRKAYSGIFLKTFNLQLSKDESLPRVICTPCVHKLIDATEFREMVVESEQKLLSGYVAPSIEFVEMKGGCQKVDRDESKKHAEEGETDPGEEVEMMAAEYCHIELDNQSMNDPMDDSGGIEPIRDPTNDEEEVLSGSLLPVTPLGLHYRRYLMSRLRGKQDGDHGTQGPSAQSKSLFDCIVLDKKDKGAEIIKTIKTERTTDLEGTNALEKANVLEEITEKKSSGEKVIVKNEVFMEMVEEMMSDDDDDSDMEFDDSPIDQPHGSSNRPPIKRIAKPLSKYVTKKPKDVEIKKEKEESPEATNTSEKTKTKIPTQTKNLVATRVPYKRAYVIKQKDLVDQVKVKYKYDFTKNKVEDPKISYATFVLEHSNALPFQYKGKYLCAFCHDTCGDIHELRNHTKIHNVSEGFRKKIAFPLALEVTALTCSTCNCRVPNLDALISHLENIHAKKPQSENEGSVIPIILSEKDLKCMQCEEKFTTLGRLLAHSNKHYQIHICDQCGVGFPSQRKLKAHSNLHEEETRGCPQCGVMLATKAAWKYHMVEAHGKKDRYKCPVCNLAFRTYARRQRHLKNEHGQNIDFVCSECPRSFVTTALRKKHYLRVHLKVPEKRNRKKAGGGPSRAHYFDFTPSIAE